MYQFASQVSPPDKHGFCSLGTSVDCARAAIQNAKHIIGQVIKHRNLLQSDLHSTDDL